MGKILVLIGCVFFLISCNHTHEDLGNKLPKRKSTLSLAEIEKWRLETAQKIKKIKLDEAGIPIDKPDVETKDVYVFEHFLSDDYWVYLYAYIIPKNDKNSFPYILGKNFINKKYLEKHQLKYGHLAERPWKDWKELRNMKLSGLSRGEIIEICGKPDVITNSNIEYLIERDKMYEFNTNVIQINFSFDGESHKNVLVEKRN